ncbi:MAG: RNA-protein complex protein Nop10 [Sulfolobales archaeon]|nr:RNA-protein complex protein Nop10 [Sulfolobales archaeon]MCX8198613.1 RNA-protein complex protein Nop10 [Sulfolobales archaeon]MDW8169687.1 RNA-protein complex protein Nop10 [Desulfurococcaceae archaeon]
MKWLMRRCIKCGRYTLKDRCPICSSQVIVPHPPRFSPEDRFVEYRVKAKMELSPAIQKT